MKAISTEDQVRLLQHHIRDAQTAIKRLSNPPPSKYDRLMRGLLENDRQNVRVYRSIIRRLKQPIDSEGTTA